MGPWAWGLQVEHLLSLFPEPFDTCFLVNSGSEANEVAMRLAGAYTGRTDMAVSEVGYHGITQKALDISHYKFAGSRPELRKELTPRFSRPPQDDQAVILKPGVQMHLITLLNIAAKRERALRAF